MRAPILTPIWMGLALCTAAGCQDGRVRILSGRPEQGLVIVLPGIEGRGLLNEAICRGLAAGGVDYAVQLNDWTHSLSPLVNLRAELKNRQIASRLADRIVRYQETYPGRPVYLVGQSGGAAIAVWTAEALPPGHGVEGVVMLAGALSPRYMLEFALSKCRRGVINFHSSRDWFLLGVGTTVAGTMDGEYTSSAGRTGFDVPPPGARPPVYDKLFQVAWTSKMASSGNFGEHLTSGAEAFIATYVAPFLRADAWDEPLVTRVTGVKEPAGKAPASGPAGPSQRPPTGAAGRAGARELLDLRQSTNSRKERGGFAAGTTI